MVEPTLAGVAAVIRAHRFRYTNEDRLQEGIHAALVARGLPAEREWILSRRDRIDLLVGRVGVEVKVAGRVPDVLRQLLRYLESDQVDSLVLVTNRVRHVQISAQIPADRLEVVTIVGAGL